MKLRSSSSTSFPNLVPGTTAFADNNSAMWKALRNPLVVDIVFAKLNLFELKSARLVCREWGEVGASVLGKRTFLNASQLFRNDGSKLYQTTPVAQHLTRRLAIEDEFNPSVPTKKDANAVVITKVLSALVSQFTREIKFDVYREEGAIAFVNGMRKLKKSTTNIQRISVSAWQMPGEAGYPAYTKKLPVQTNLTSIEFKVYRLSRKRSLGFHAFQPLLQILLDSAPNLTSLDVISPFYPNLEGCKKLKVLKFMPYVFQNFDLAAEIGMLAQVKESLIEMELRYVGDKMIEMPRSQNLDVPVMSKLVSLTIYPPIMYLFQDFFHEDHLPALKSLILTTKYFRSAGFESHLNLWKRHRGVQSIKLQLDSLTQMDANALGRQIVGLFPSVKKFELISYLGWTNSIQGINQMMTPYQNWNLEEGNVFGDGINASSTFFAVLENMAKWKGVKRVHFKYQRSTRDAFFAAIKDLNLQSRGFKSVKISDYNRITITDPEILEVLTDF